MQDFHPPLDDMRFVMRHVAGGSALASLPGFEQCTDDLRDAVLDEAGRFASAELAPLNRSGDLDGAVLENGVVRTAGGFREAYRQFADARLGRARGTRGSRRPGPALAVEHRRQRIVGRRQRLVPALPAAVPGGDRRDPPVRHGGAAPGLWRAAGQRALDRGDVPDRAAGGLGRGCPAHPRRPRRRPLPDHRHQDLHHLGRARPRREHRPSGAGTDRRRPRRHQGHLPVHRAQVPAGRRRRARDGATTCAASPSSTSWACARARPASWPMATTKGPSASCSGSRTRACAACSP